MTEEIKILFPGKELNLSTGEQLIIKPFTFGQLPKALSLASKISFILAEMYNEGKFEDKKKISQNLMQVLSQGGEDLIQLIALGVDKPREWFDGLPGDDGINVMVAFLEVNIDFFTQRMMPQLLAQVEKLPKPKEKV